MSISTVNNVKDKVVDKIWLDSEVQLLKKWGEISASYRLLHDRAFREFQIKSYGLSIPVIILSTLSGTASFSISSFPEDLQTYVPMVIGGINIIGDFFRNLFGGNSASVNSDISIDTETNSNTNAGELGTDNH